MRASATCSLAGLLTALLVAAASPSASQVPPPANLRSTAADPILEAARQAFEALPEAERRALQEALGWVGDYTGTTDGSFGRQTHEAMTAYQRRSGRKPDGVLDAAARAALVAAAREARERVGFEVIQDSRSGVRIGVPLRLLTRRDVNQSGGTRWQSTDQKITLDTRSVPPSGGSLQDLFDRNLAIRTPGRLVTYKVLRHDFFVIAGETATGKFFTRYGAGDGGLRGFSIGYDKALAQEIEPVVVAIANSFTPFPVAPPAVAAVPSPRPEPSKEPAVGFLGTGLVIGPHRVVTSVGSDDCANLRAGGFRPRQVHRRNGLTLLEFAESLRPATLRLARLASGPEEPSASLLVLAFARQGSALELVLAPAAPESDGTISAPLQPGARGAPVFDRSGVLRGLVRHGPDERRMVAGIVARARYEVESAGLAGLLVAGPPPGDTLLPRSAAEIVSAVREAIVPVTCEP